MQYGLSDYTLNTIQSILRKYPGIHSAILYGSRAKGNFRTGSDIDLTLNTAEDFSFTDFLRVVDDFDESDMPYLVDLSEYRRLSNAALKGHIDRVGKVLYRLPQ
jgi:predicted nucleotidyltransferase